MVSFGFMCGFMFVVGSYCGLFFLGLGVVVGCVG